MDGTYRKTGCNLVATSRFVSDRAEGLLSVMLVRYSQLLAALGATRSQHAATVLGGHTLAETMLVHAAAIVRLKCSFHCNDSLFISTNFLKSLDLGCKITNNS